jgi:hypothetical protein
MVCARKIKLHLPAPKPRNPMVTAAAKRKAGAHRITEKARRRREKMELARLDPARREG